MSDLIAPERAASADRSVLDLARRASAVTAALVERRIRPGERVAVLLPHGVEQVAWILGAAAAGAIAVPVAPKLKDRQVRHVLADSEPVVVVVDTVRRAGLLDPDAILAMALACGARVVDAADVPDLPADGRPPLGALDGTAPAVLLYTSGSTGRPKGIVQSHRSLVDGARIVAGYLGLRRDDRILATLPASFDYGLNQSLLALQVGCAIDYREFFTARDLVGALHRHRTTVLAGVPPLWIALSEVLANDAEVAGNLASLRVLTNSGGRLPERAIAVLRRSLPAAAIHSMYGLSEAFRSTTLPPQELDRRPRSIGRAIPEVELLVLDEDGAPVADGEVGELVHCGALVADGYWRRPADTARVFRPDPRLGARAGALAVWSGDLVRRDAEGYLEFVVRRDEQLKIRGWRISTDEVLDVVRDVAGVGAAVAFGVPRGEQDPDLAVVFERSLGSSAGEVSDAFLIDGVRAACRRELPAPMVPTIVEITDSIPRTPHGKFDVVKLRSRFLGR